MSAYRRVRCPICGWDVAVRRGRLALHGRRPRRPEGCEGSYMTADDASDYPDDWAENNPEPKIGR
jgi:hypothetical protein